MGESAPAPALGLGSGASTHVGTSPNGEGGSFATDPGQFPAETLGADPEIATLTVPEAGRTYSHRQLLAWYGGLVLVTSILVFFGYRLDNTQALNAPFYYDYDSLLILPMVKATIEGGTHWQNVRMGYPGVQVLYDFPVVDHLHFAIIWLLGQVFSNAVFVFNLYYLLTYPLSALTAMGALRRLGLSFPAAATGGLLFAFLPYHYMRGENHYFLSAYWMVPISLLLCMDLLRGDIPFFPETEPGRRRFRPFRRASLMAVVIGLLTSAAGAYYAFFACFLYAASGLYGWLAFRTYRAAVSAVLLCGVVVVGGLANHLPTFIYQARYGVNSITTRWPEEAEIYGLKIAHILLPIDDHNLTVFARVKALYNGTGLIRPCQNENASAALGIVGSTGLVGLLVVLLLPNGPRGWPLRPLAVITGFTVLFTTIGGFGAVFNQLIFDQIRCYNRISVYLAFIALFAVLWCFDRYFATRVGRVRWARYPVFAAVALGGFLDQTPFSWFRDFVIQELQVQSERFQADARFFAKIEESMPPGSKIFNLPFMPYPEVERLNQMNTYEPARGFVHTRTLIWSYGAVKGRESDAWQRQVSAERPGEMLTRVVVRGFDGVVIDTRGYPRDRTGRNSGELLIDEIQKLAKDLCNKPLPIIVHENLDPRQVFLDLRPYRDALRGRDPGQFQAWQREEENRITVLWLDSMWSPEPPGDDDRMHWCGKRGTIVLINPTEQPKSVEVSMTFGVDRSRPFGLKISGLISDTMTLIKEPQAPDLGKAYWQPHKYSLTLPPGRHAIRFQCTPPPDFMPVDSRQDCFFIQNFSLKEK